MLHQLGRPQKLQLFNKHTIYPTEVLTYLQSALAYFSKEKGTIPYMRLRELMLALPRTSGKERDPFWDQIPSEDVPQVIIALNKLAEVAIESGNIGIPPDESVFESKTGQNKCCIHNCEIGLIAYDIAAQIAARDNELRLNGEYVFELSDMYLDQDIFHDVESYEIVKRIIEKFKSRSRGKKSVFGASIDKKSKDDPTRNYVLKNLLTEEGKQAWCLYKTNERFPQNYPEHKCSRTCS